MPQSEGGVLSPEAFVDLYWLPLGAGGHFVRLNGRLYEAAVAALEHRPRRDLYHSALEVRLPGTLKFVHRMADHGDRTRRRRHSAAA